MNFKLDYISDTRKGVRRDRNQDSCLVIQKDNYSLFMIFDGVSSIATSHLFIKEFKARMNLASKNNPNFHLELSEILFRINNAVQEIRKGNFYKN